VPDIYLGCVTSHPGQLSLAIPSSVCTMSTSQRAVTPCGCQVKQWYGMVNVNLYSAIVTKSLMR